MAGAGAGKAASILRGRGQGHRQPSRGLYSARRNASRHSHSQGGSKKRWRGKPSPSPATLARSGGWKSPALDPVSDAKRDRKRAEINRAKAAPPIAFKMSHGRPGGRGHGRHSGDLRIDFQQNLPWWRRRDLNPRPEDGLGRILTSPTRTPGDPLVDPPPPGDRPHRAAAPLRRKHHLRS